MYSPTPDAAAPPKSRQRHGLACEECQKRKLRCDGQQPQCEANPIMLLKVMQSPNTTETTPALSDFIFLLPIQ
jgi:hypothetical protein